jgi:putative tryptophan/tyrosine transport system substrate-binding protein
VPGASRLGILSPAHNTGAAEWITSMEAVSQALDMVPRAYRANTADELRRVLSGINARTDVLVTAPDHSYLLHRTMIISAAMALRIQVVCQQPEYVLDGALLSFDPNRVEMYRRLAYYVDAVLKGARPSDLPIEEPAKSWLMINLRTAKSLGIEMPGPVLMRADQIIE